MAAPRFAFEELTAPINWPRVASTNVRQLQKLGDASALRAFLADVCVGDADDGFLAYGGDDRGLGRKALRMNQYATQYLLYSQQILAAQKATLEKGRDRLRRKERAEKRRYLARKEKLRILEEEVAKQDRLIATHQAVLQSVNPDVARRVAQEADGRVVVLPPEDAPRPARRPATPESYHDGFTDPESSAGSDGELVARPPAARRAREPVLPRGRPAAAHDDAQPVARIPRPRFVPRAPARWGFGRPQPPRAPRPGRRRRRSFVTLRDRSSSSPREAGRARGRRQEAPGEDVGDLAVAAAAAELDRAHVDRARGLD